MAADWLTSAWDQNSGLFATSPAVSVIEETAGGWLRELFGLPRATSVGFVTGCQMANFTGLAAGAACACSNAPAGTSSCADSTERPRSRWWWARRRTSPFSPPCRFLGLGRERVHRVAADGQGRMRADLLRDHLRALPGGPTIVCAQVGNVNSGACDPMTRIADAAAERGAWLHVDGAFGLWAAASSVSAPPDGGVERADSWATDAHKWLNVPYDCGVAIVRSSGRPSRGDDHGGALSRADARQRDGLVGLGAGVLAPWPRGSGLRGVAHLGRQGVAALIERCCALARRMAERLSAAPGIEILNDVALNQVLVRFHARDGEDEKAADELTRRVVSGVQTDGTCWLSGSNWHGRAVMRISVSNWSTRESDIDRSAEAILRIASSQPAH